MPLQSSGIIVVEKPIGIKAKTSATSSTSMVGTLHNQSQQQHIRNLQQQPDQQIVNAVTSVATIDTITSQATATLLTPTSHKAATLLTPISSSAQYIEYFDANNVRYQQQKHQKIQQHHPQQQRNPYQLQYTKQVTSSYQQQQQHQKQHAIVENISSSSSERSCNNSSIIGICGTSLKKRQQNKINSRNTNANISSGGNGTNAKSANALIATTSGVHQIQIKSLSQQQQQQQQQLQSKFIQAREEQFEQVVSSTSAVSVGVDSDVDNNTNEENAKNKMIISTTAEMLNQQQVYKIVAADGTTSNMIIDTLGNVTATSGGAVSVSSGSATSNVIVNNSVPTISAASSGNASKVLLGNLTVLSSKHHNITSGISASTAVTTCSTVNSGQLQQQIHSQTINFVSAKNLPFLTAPSTPSGSNAGVTTTTSVTTSYSSMISNAKQQQPQKFSLSSNNYKNSSLNKHNQQITPPSTPSTTYLLQQQQKIQNNVAVAASLASRPVQMVTRVQTLLPHSATVVSNSSLQTQQQSQALLQQHTQTKQFLPSKMSSISYSNSNNNNSSVITGSNNFRKSSITSSGLKISTTNKQQTMSSGTVSSIIQHPGIGCGLGIKTTFNNQHYQSANCIGSNSIIGKTKSSKFVKQYSSNGTNNSAGASSGTYTINHQKFQNVAQQQPQLLHQPTASTTKINKVPNKYILQQSPATQQHIVNLPHGTHLQHKGVLSATSAVSHHACNPSKCMSTAPSTTIYQQISNNSSSGSSGVSNTNSTSIAASCGGTIKFVNAHGTVIQQHPGSSQAMTLHVQNDAAASPTTSTISSLTMTISPSSTPSAVSTSLSPSSSSVTTPLFADDIVIVNGTQMTDELSARILQSMSQKSFTNSQQRYQQHQKVTVSANGSNGGSSGSTGMHGSMLPPATHLQQQQQQISNILLTSKEYYNPAQSATVVTTQKHPSMLSPSISPTTCPNSPVSPFIQQNSNVPSVSASSEATAYGPLSSSTIVQVPASSVSISYVPTPLSMSVVSAGSTRQTNSAPGSRLHFIERKLHESGGATRKNTEVCKLSKNTLGLVQKISSTNSAGISATPMEQPSAQQQHLQQPHTQVIHLQTLKATTTLSTALPATISTIMSIMPSIDTSNTSSSSNPNGLNNASTVSNGNDDDIIGEEVRPVPVLTQDFRLQVLHAVLQDHTYANAMPIRLPTDFNVHQMLMQHQQQQQMASIVLSSTTVNDDSNCRGLISALSGSNIGASDYSQNAAASTVPTSALNTQQWSIGNTTSNVSTVMSNQQQHQQHQHIHSSYTTIYGQSIPRLQEMDDDAHSAISNGSRNATGDIDPGEETETAPEAEAEDDSVTRCICDLTHDDGYMICCDKCLAWQHVDCMGIDRLNIPDEYLCELCQPRVVNKSRARALQILKRKEQSQAVIAVQTNATFNLPSVNVPAGVGLIPHDGNSQRLINATASVGGAAGISNSYQSNFSGINNALHTLSNAALGLNRDSPNLSGSSYTTKKNKMLKKVKDLGNISTGSSGRKSKKADRHAVIGSVGVTDTNALTGVGGHNRNSGSGKPMRKEARKNVKRKTKGASGSDSNSCSASGASAVAGKHAANLRHWIEKYELAVTNHYSPELRARLHAITKQPSLLQSILNTENKALKDCGNLDNRATTVPHAGGKILISNRDIGPNYPISELRGKYMLMTQYKMQNSSINMNMPPPSNYQLIASHKAQKTPGPFIFFYQLPGAEAPMQSMNPDGTYPLLPPQPAYLKGPEICVDTRTYGNEARFVRRSCRPNAEIQHLFEKGTIHLFLVSLTTIRASTEITIRHEPHDIQAVESRKSSALIVKPTSTACACGLSNDCLFGPPLPKLPPGATKSGRKSGQLRSDKKVLFHNSPGPQPKSIASTSSSAVLNSPVSKKKSTQILNRNRSTSSSGDSNMGNGTGFQSPNITQMHLGGPMIIGAATAQTATIAPVKSMSLGNSVPPNNNVLALTGCGNSTSSMHDSGICTSSSSPSVSIPSPTPQHMHSPTQQQTTVLQRNLIIQQQNPQHQHVLATIPSSMLIASQFQQQPLAVMAGAAVVADQIPVAASDVVPDANSCSESLNEQTVVPQKQEFKVDTTQLAAAAALQSLNSSIKAEQRSLLLKGQPTTTTSDDAASSQPTKILMSSQCSSDKQKQQQQEVKMADSTTSPQEKESSSMVVPSKTLKTQKRHPSNISGSGKADASVPDNDNNQKVDDTGTSDGDIVTPVPQISPAQSTLSASTTTTSTLLTSTPKDKPKLSREDRKMEAILRAIEKMERSQQRKEAKAPKANKKRLQNESASKRAVAAQGSLGTKRGGRAHATRKKKRKTNKSHSGGGGHGHGFQRKRHKSNRINSNDSDADTECAAVTSESEGTLLLSPNLTITGRQTPLKTLDGAGGVKNNMILQQRKSASQAAGILMAFASSPVDDEKTLPSSSASVDANDGCFKSPQKGPVTASNACRGVIVNTASPPPTTPTSVSSACLLIEAAVGPLDGFDGSSNISEFKYPSKAKTKKSLMSNWLHQSNPESMPESSQIVTSSNNSNSGVGLDSLVQVAMCDFDKDKLAQQTIDDTNINSEIPKVTDRPQHLSVVAMKVEEFIFQTERSSSPMNIPGGQLQHIPPVRYELSSLFAAVGVQHEQEQQQNTIEFNEKSDRLTDQVSAARNLHLPLQQVSSCSNNSSVKKRWLRQAISEETDDGVVVSSSLNTTPQSLTSPGVSSSTMMANGFTTPLKKRRLVINNKEDSGESDGGGSGGHNTIPSPKNKADISEEQVEEEEIKRFGYQYLISVAATSSNEEEGDAVVDVIKCGEDDDELIVQEEEECNDNDIGTQMETDTVDFEGGEQDKCDSRVGSFAASSTVLEGGSTSQPRTKGATKQFNESREVVKDVKPEFSQSKIASQDQEDVDVDILRSPSPGQQIVAEDNLVKIEPEDISGDEDVKIDVEREESLANDNFDEILKGKQQSRPLEDTFPASEEEVVEKVDVKKECRSPTAQSKENTKLSKILAHTSPNDTKKCEQLGLKRKQFKEPQEGTTMLDVKNTPSKDSRHSLSNECHKSIEDIEPFEKKPKISKTELIEDKVDIKEGNEKVKLNTEITMESDNAAVTTFSSNKNLINKQQLSDVDLENRLRSFHRENILLLQTRNKQQQTTTEPTSNTELLKVTTSRSATPDYNKFELDTVKPSPSSPSTTSLVLQHDHYQQQNCDVSSTAIVPNTASKSSSVSSKHSVSSGSNKQSSSSVHGSHGSSSSSSKKLHKRSGRNRERERERDYRDRCHDRSRQRERGRQRKRNHSYDHSRDGERGRSHNRSYDRDRSREKNRERDRSYERNRSRDRSYDYIHDHSCDRSYERNRSRDHSRERNSSISFYYGSTSSKVSSSSTASNSMSNYNANGHNAYSHAAVAFKKIFSNPKSSKKSSALCLNNLSTITTTNGPDLMLSAGEKSRFRTISSSLLSPLTALTSSSTNNSNRKRLNFGDDGAKESGDPAWHAGGKYNRRDDRGREYKEEATTDLGGGGGKSRLHGESSNQQQKSTHNNLQRSSAAPISQTTASTTTLAKNATSPTVYSIPVIESGTTSGIMHSLVETQISKQISTVQNPYLYEHQIVPQFNFLTATSTLPTTTFGHSSKAVGAFVTSVTTISNVSNLPVTIAAVTSPLAPMITVGGVTVNNCASASVLPHESNNNNLSSSDSMLSAASNNQLPPTTNTLPFYNTIYGKLLDHVVPVALLPQASASGAARSSNLPSEIAAETSLAVGENHDRISNINSQESIPTDGSDHGDQRTATAAGSDHNIVNYFDSNLKGYSTLSGYVSHSALFDLGNKTKFGSSIIGCGNSTVLGHTAAGVSSKESISLSSVDNVGSSTPPSTLATAAPVGKLPILTRTASHDPRLNPILSAPEPPPVPKRKLSINEYRRRMKQSSSSSSLETNSSATITPTTSEPPPVLCNTTSASRPLLLLSADIIEETHGNGKTMPAATTASTLHKQVTTFSRCTLNSPERVEQSAAQKLTGKMGPAIKKHNTNTSSSVDGLYTGVDPLALSLHSAHNTRSSVEGDLKKGQFNAAPTLLEKQQEKLCERLKSLKSQQTNSSQLTNSANNMSSSEVNPNEFILSRSLMQTVNHDLDNCLEAISSTSTSMESSRESSPERGCYVKKDVKLTETMTSIAAPISKSSETLPKPTAAANQTKTTDNIAKPQQTGIATALKHFENNSALNADTNKNPNLNANVSFKQQPQQQQKR